MSENEIPVVNAVCMAIEEINRKGGILRKKIEPIIVDGASKDETFIKGAKKLLLQDQVKTVFGCWMSSHRKAVLPIFEENKAILFYPVQYEGLESSDFIMYMGATPNQQIIPATQWCLKNLGKNIFLVGSDYIFPKLANLTIKGVLQSLGGHVCGENYIPLGSNNVKDVVESIKRSKPDVILNTINGDTNRAFFKEMRAQNISPKQTPTMSFCLGEQGFKTYHLIENSIGDYVCWNYFQSLETKTNKSFVQKYKKKYGQDEMVEDPMESAYLGVFLWKMAVERAKSFDVLKVQKALKGLRILAPEGPIRVDESHNHMWKFVRIAQFNESGQFTVLWSSKTTLKPEAFPQIGEI